MNKADIIKAQKEVLEVYKNKLYYAKYLKNTEEVKEIKAALKSKLIKKAFAVFKTNDLQKIEIFFKNEFAQYPQSLRAIIFENTASFVVDGKSIYENPSINVFYLLKPLDDRDASIAVKELFKAGFNPAYVPHLFPKYVNTRFGAMSTLGDLFKEIEFLAQLSYTAEQNGTKVEVPYISASRYGALFSDFFTVIGKDKASQIDLTEYVNKLKALQSKYPNLQIIKFLQNASLYTPLINENNVLQFAENPETLDALFDNYTFLETMKNVFLSLDSDAKIEYLKKYINHPKFKMIIKPNETIAKMLRIKQSF